MDIKKLTRHEVSTLLCVTERSVNSMVERGLPQQKPDKGNPYYVWSEVLDWLIVEKIRIAEIRKTSNQKGAPLDADSDTSVPSIKVSLARKEAALASLREHELAVAQGEYIKAEEARTTMFNIGRRARDMLLAVPDRVAPLVIGLDDAYEAHRILTEEMRRVCVELGKMKNISEK